MGCRQAPQHLIELGYWRIGFISGVPGRGMAEVRDREYRAAMAEFGLDIPEGYVVCGRIPRDLSVVGFSDSSAAGLGAPSLTTISQPVEVVGRTAARLVIARLQQPGGLGAEEVLLPTQLVVRESTAAHFNDVQHSDV